VVYDGENGLGQVVSAACCEHVIRLAQNFVTQFLKAFRGVLDLARAAGNRR
jgi:hypothetical protein